MLFQLVRGLRVPFGFERSFRVRAGALLTNRFLLSVSKGSVGADPHEAVLGLCQRLGMPAGFLEATGSRLAAARFVHFGFEEDLASCLYKVYLEFGAPAERTHEPAPVLLHLAFKWDALRPARCVSTRYLWHAGLSAGDVLDRLSEVYRDARAEEPLDFARGVLLLAAGRMARGVRAGWYPGEYDGQRQNTITQEVRG